MVIVCTGGEHDPHDRLVDGKAMREILKGKVTDDRLIQGTTGSVCAPPSWCAGKH